MGARDGDARDETTQVGLFPPIEPARRVSRGSGSPERAAPRDTQVYAVDFEVGPGTAIGEFQIEGPGIKTTIPFHERVFAHPVFRSGDFTTNFLEQNDLTSAPSEKEA